MPLPILKSAVTATPADLVRYFHKLELEWARHLGEETELDCGTAIISRDLPNVHDGNRLLDAALPPSISVESAAAAVQRHFADAGCTCDRWVMNPSAESSRVLPLVENLLSRGFSKQATDIFHLPQLPSIQINETPGLKIIPARASYRHLRILSEEKAARWNEPQLADAAELHLDDPRFDALLAIKEGTAAGYVGALIVGEVAGIQTLFVSERFRRQGIGRTMMNRALEICVRSLARHVLLGVDPTNDPAVNLYKSFGFEKIGEFVAYAPPR
jgi:GNAT superfamily N-acetyltransferase